MKIEDYIKNVESAVSALKNAVKREQIRNQSDKTYEQINEELNFRL